jgi:hypothetical protein
VADTKGFGHIQQCAEFHFMTNSNDAQEQKKPSSAVPGYTDEDIDKLCKRFARAIFDHWLKRLRAENAARKLKEEC